MDDCWCGVHGERQKSATQRAISFISFRFSFSLARSLLCRRSHSPSLPSLSLVNSDIFILPHHHDPVEENVQPFPSLFMIADGLNL
jgi:hypothetical protein